MTSTATIEKTAQKAILNAAISPNDTTLWSDPDLRLYNGYRKTAPPLPAKEFGEFWEKWILENAAGKSCPPDYVASGLLATVSALIGNAYWVSPWPSWKEPPILWFCNVGNPSSGKTPGINAALEIVRELEIDINGNFDDEISQYERQKETASVRKKQWQDEVKQATEAKSSAPVMPEDALEPEKPSRKRILACDATVEILAPMLEKNPKGILYFRDELSGWLGAMDQYKGGSGSDRAFWLEAFNGNGFTVDRVKTGLDGSVTVQNLSLSVLGGIQPDKLQRILLNGADDGLAARFCYLWPESLPPQTPTAQPDNSGAMNAFHKLHSLVMHVSEDEKKQPHIIELEKKAIELLEEFRKDVYNEERSVSGLYLSHIGKNAGRALRLALVLEFLWWSVSDLQNPPRFVSREALFSALILIDDYFRPMARRAFDSAALPFEVRNAVTIGKWVMRNKYKEISSREIQRASLGGLDNHNDIDNALEELQEANWIMPNPGNQNTGGRPRKNYDVNPKLWEI